MHVPPPQAVANAATGTLVGPVSVVLAVFTQSTWNFHRLSEFVPKFSRKFGEPAGGAVALSRSEGRTPPKALVSWKHCCVAGCPLSIDVRSKAHSLLPWNELPLKML